ncbi:hypothetical protein IJU97_06110 [bacterium]|nr:hypothetical protein [bacterium]
MKLQDLTGIVVDYQPTQFKFEKYQLPGFIIDKARGEMFEAEELLAIILDYSREAENWIAVELRKFDEDVQHSYFNLQEKNIKLFDRTIADFHAVFKQNYSYLRDNGYLHAKTQDFVLYIYPSEEVLKKLKKFI